MLQHELTQTRITAPKSALTHILAAARVYLARSRQRATLSRLDAHMLRDIGLDTDRVRQECAKPFWRD